MNLLCTLETTMGCLRRSIAAVKTKNSLWVSRKSYIEMYALRKEIGALLHTCSCQ